jgi:hypothetical protein
MTAPTIYQSTDASAPVLTGQVGGMLTVLDACLVNGYGAKSAAGWTIPFTGTNVRSYRPPTGNRFYLGVDDNNNTAVGTNLLRWRGFETMTAAGAAVASGTNPFPSDVDLSGGWYTRKSSVTTATARAWIVIANDRFVVWIINCGDTGQYDVGGCFGDFLPYSGSDAFNTLSLGDNGTGVSDTSTRLISADSLKSGASNHYAARVAAGTGTSAASGRYAFGSGFGNATTILMTSASGAMTYPGPLGGVILAPVLVGNGSTTPCPRGQLPFLWACASSTTDINSAGWAAGDTFSGAAGSILAGRTFMVIKFGSSAGWLVIETSTPTIVSQ